MPLSDDAARDVKKYVTTQSAEARFQAWHADGGREDAGASARVMRVLYATAHDAGHAAAEERAYA